MVVMWIVWGVVGPRDNDEYLRPLGLVLLHHHRAGGWIVIVVVFAHTMVRESWERRRARRRNTRGDGSEEQIYGGATDGVMAEIRELTY